jgi:hypothetical protein
MEESQSLRLTQRTRRRASAPDDGVHTGDIEAEFTCDDSRVPYKAFRAGSYTS